jgi:hypothetical protein
MQKEFPSAKRFVLCVPAVAIGTDMNIMEKYFSILYTTVTVLKIDSSLTNSLDFCPAQNDTGFKSVR